MEEGRSEERRLAVVALVDFKHIRHRSVLDPYQRKAGRPFLYTPHCIFHYSRTP